MLQIREHVSLAPFTTLGIGGPARYFAEALDEGDVEEALAFCSKQQLALFVLGGGSNLVIADAGWPGLVLRVQILGTNQRKVSGGISFEAGAGEDWDGLVAQTVASDCGGMECLSGIPGTVGGTPVQNVGAYGQEVADTIQSVRAIRRSDGIVREFANAECGFAYRTSLFNGVERDQWIVTSVSFLLQEHAAPRIEYADLKRHFENQPAASLQEVRDAVRSIRRSKGMLLVEGDPDVRSAGSFFKNPIVKEERFRELEAATQSQGLKLPSYPAGAGERKLSAAWLVEKAGFHRGFEHGRVGISSKHTLAIVNRGGANSADVVEFMSLIRERVDEKFGIALHPEPVFIGFGSEVTL